MIINQVIKIVLILKDQITILNMLLYEKNKSLLLLKLEIKGGFPMKMRKIFILKIYLRKYRSFTTKIINQRKTF